MNNINTIKELLKREVDAVNNLEKSLNFEIVEKASNKIANCKGNIIFAGCGSPVQQHLGQQIYIILYIFLQLQ